MVRVEAISDDPALGNPSLERRVDRLEHAVAALQDTEIVEERIVARVTQQLKRSPLKSLRESATAVIDSSRMLLPKSEPAASDNYDAAEDAKHEATATSTESARSKPGWFLIQLWSEVRTFWKSLFDHRYTFSMTGRVAPIGIAFTYLFTWLFIGGIAFVGSVTERIIDVALAMLLYKVLSREVQRYRSMFPH